MRSDDVQDESPDDDPAPEPPVRPSMEDCCQGGCTRCVFDLYDEAMERYRERLRAWQRRQPASRMRDARSLGSSLRFLRYPMP